MQPVVVQQFLLDMVGDDLHSKSKAIEQLVPISKCLGEKRTRNELIPFLNKEVCNDDSVQLLILLAECTPRLAPLLGGGHYLTLLFPLLESLANHADKQVRAKATKSLMELLNKLNILKCESFVKSLLQRLFQSENYLSLDVFCRLAAHLYPLSSTCLQNYLIQKYLQLINEVSPSNVLARKFASQHIVRLVRLMPNEHDNEILFALMKLTQDPLDLVRAHLPQCLVPLAGPSNIDNYKSNVMCMVKQFAEDKSWRVRTLFIQCFSQTCANMDQENIKKLILPYVMKFLQDQEPEINAAVVKHLYPLCFYLEDAQVIQVLQQVQPYVKSPHLYLVQTLAQQLPRFASFLSAPQIQEHIMPTFCRLAEHPEKSIQLTLFTNIDSLFMKAQVESTLRNQIFQTIQRLTRHQDWHTKVAVMKHLPLVCANIKDKSIQKKLLDIILELTKDRVSQVRQATVALFQELIKTMGTSWFMGHVMESVLQLGKSQNYQRRIVLLKVLEVSTRQYARESLYTYRWTTTSRCQGTLS